MIPARGDDEAPVPAHAALPGQTHQARHPLAAGLHSLIDHLRPDPRPAVGAIGFGADRTDPFNQLHFPPTGRALVPGEEAAG